jgi:hypothetical protein
VGAGECGVFWWRGAGGGWLNDMLSRCLGKFNNILPEFTSVQRVNVTPLPGRVSQSFPKVFM